MDSAEGRNKIYFAGSIRGGREDAAIYLEIVRMLCEYGQVLTEHIGEVSLTSVGEVSDDRCIHDRDLDWLRESKFLVAEVTCPSLGVGYEVGKATEWGKQVLCIFREINGRSLSAMIAGCSGVTVRKYEDLEELRPIFDEFLKE